LKNNQKANLLLVEDDPSLGERLRKGLQQEGFVTVLARSGADGLANLRGGAFDLVILDWMLPDFSGVELLATLRAEAKRLPVLFLTARDEVEDRVKGLDSGADDYLTKPFAFSELLARIRTLLRRMAVTTEKILEFGSLRIDLITRKASCNLQPIELTPREFDLLAVLANPEGDTVSRETLSHDVWQKAGRFTSLDNVIDVHLTHLRKKLRASMGDDPIKTVRGVGYTFQRIA
jgi:two-component system copper resistance phosphate regulon response regulator CusR